MSEVTHEIALPGCTPTPLAHYLKALGVLRLVSEQADAEVRGWWQDDLLHLRSALDIDELLEFFLHDYRPTPLVAPWNGGSGFYPNDKKAGIEPLCSAASPRLSHYAESIKVCQCALEEFDIDKAPKDDEKKLLLTACRAKVADEVVTWLDAAFVLTNEKPLYPPLLGTGGNDGRLEFTNNFMQRVVEVMLPETGEPTPRSESWLKAALFDIAVHDRLRRRAAEKPIGQFFPGGLGRRQCRC